MKRADPTCLVNPASTSCVENVNTEKDADTLTSPTALQKHLLANLAHTSPHREVV